MPVVVGIDQGTTGTRAVAMDAAGRTVAQAYRPHRQLHPRAGWVEHDAVEIWDNVRAVLLDVAALIQGPIAAVGLANQGETVLAWDRDSGKPAYHAIVWQDTRAQAAMDALAEDASLARVVRERTGLRLDPYFAAGKLRWLVEHAPASAVSTLDAWLLSQLTGGAVYLTDASTAARTLLYDIHTLSWDDELCARLGVPRALLPTVVPSVGSFGTLAGLGPRLDGVPIVVGMVDQPAAMIGQGCLAAGSVKATYGTGCFVYSNTGGRAVAAEGLLTTLAWQRDGAACYALDGGVLTAGSVLGWLRDGVGLIGDVSDAAVESDVLFVPALAGLGAPHWRRRARGAWLGLELSTSRAHLLHAALAGIAARTVEIVGAMERATGTPLVALRVDGGLTGSATLMQLQADLLGIPVEVAAEPEATAFGVCALAARAVGVWARDDEITRRAVVARRYLPRLAAAERERRRARFARAVAAVAALDDDAAAGDNGARSD